MRRLCDFAITLACAFGLVLLNYAYKEITK